MKYLTSSLFVLCVLFSSIAKAQLNNPNKLPVCTGTDTTIWTNCFGSESIPNRHNYTGDYLNGTRHGYGVMDVTFEKNRGDKYIGEFKSGKYHGQGMYTYVNGNKYVGEYKDGKMNGQGTFTYANGNKYVGEFKDSTWNGQGTYYHLANDQFKGYIHIGEYKDSKRNGQGTATYADGNKYVGEFKDDKKNGQGTATYVSGNKYVGEFKDDMRNGQGTFTFANGEKYVGEFKDEKYHGQGTTTFPNGNKFVGEYKSNLKAGLGTFTFAQGHGYTGEWLNDKPNGMGRETYADGRQPNEGVFENGKFIRAAKINLPTQNNNVATNTDRSDIDRERKQLAEERRRLEDEKRQRQQASSSQRINLQVNHTQPNSDGLFFIDIKTNADTASLQIDGKEEGGKSDGNYTLKRIARAGQSSSFKIVATDIYGNTDAKIINVTRTISEAKASYADLNPTNIKRRSDRDAVAIIIGIADYKNLPKADFANDDARVFYDYALRALSIKPDNIKLLVDGDAGEVAIYKAFKTWLPSKVRSSTDVYVFYSGHGLPSADGKGLYLLPQQTDRDLISKTAIQMQEVISDIESSKPKSVTLFLDACYSGQSRTGETLIASARPISIRSESRIFPENFTVITASQNDQISSSNPDLKHGIFSYYLMRGMEGDADTDKDGKITLGEMQTYLVENVGRQAGMMNRKQEPQLIGDANRVLVGR